MPIAEINQPVAGAVSRTISARGFRKCAVAAEAGYSKSAFSAMLNGRKRIRPADIPRLAAALGVTPNELFADGSLRNAAMENGPPEPVEDGMELYS